MCSRNISAFGSVSFNPSNRAEEKDQMADFYTIREKQLSILPHSPIPMALRDPCVLREV